MIKAYAATDLGAKLTPFEFELPAIQPDEVCIDVDYCGLCHSDLSMINNDWGVTQYPLVPGHEVVGKVVEKGEAVTTFEVGDVVGLGWHCGYCNHCQYCEDGDKNLCAEAQGTIVQRHGGFAEKVVAQAQSIVKLPQGMNPATAGPLFCGGITVFNPLLQFDISPLSKVAVIGVGGLGHLAIKFLKAFGCEITAFSHSPEKTQALLDMGAHHVLNTNDAESVAQASGRFDLILCTINVTMNWDAFITTLAPKGRLHFLGVPSEPLSFDLTPMLFKQLAVSSSPVGSPASIAKMLEFAALHQIEPTVESFHFDQVNEAIEKMEKGELRYRAVLHF